MKFVKRDVVLWLRHLEEAGVPVPSGCAALFRFGDRDILFEPMRPGPSGRPTPGLRTTVADRAIWSSIPLGAAIDLELVRVLDKDVAAGDVAKPRLRRANKATSPSRSDEVNEFFDAVELLPPRASAFDAYLMVDWSAASPPRTGKDSVWWCLCVWRSGRLVVETNENSPTRQACFDVLRAQLRDLAAEGSSVLVGFDFPYGYPTGFAQALGLKDAPWRAVWNELTTRIVDDQAFGTNNRFQVASDLNQRIGAPEGPFWGHPQGRGTRCYVRQNLLIPLAISCACEKPTGIRGACSQPGSCGATVRSVVRPCSGFRSSRDCATTTISAASRPFGRSRPDVSYHFVGRNRGSSSSKSTRRWWSCQGNLMAGLRTPHRSKRSRGTWPNTTPLTR